MKGVNKKTLKNLWEQWKKITVKIGNFQGRIILTLLYFIFVTPIAIYLKLFYDPLKLKKSKPEWILKNIQDTTLNEMRRQFQ